MARRFEHEWGFMANHGSNGKGELAYCDLCKQWKWFDGERDSKPFKMSQDEFQRMHEAGEIDATESLGIRELEKVEYKPTHQSNAHTNWTMYERLSPDRVS
jgi:hypothetical protein